MLEAVILAAGSGTRMRLEDPSVALRGHQAVAAQVGAKGLISFAGRPFLDYVLDQVVDAGCRSACLVVAPGSIVAEHYRAEHYRADHYRAEHHRAEHHRDSVAVDLKLSFAVQESPLGTADALLAAEEIIGDRPFLLLNSDNLYPADALRGLLEAEGPAVLGVERSQATENARSNLTDERLATYAVLEIDRAGLLTGILEKPDVETWSRLPQPVVVGVNAWRFSPEIFDACRRTVPSARGELELPTAVRISIERGERFRALVTSAPILDLSSRADVPDVGRLIDNFGGDRGGGRP